MYELFEQKYKECEKSLFLVAIGYLHNTEDAKDCVQEAVLSALKAFNNLKSQEYFKTWITRIVINKSKDFIKKRRFTEELTDTLNVFYDMPTEEIGIMDCICKLNPKMSIYITLRFYNEMTYEEVAKALKQPVSTVKYKTKKALLELKKHLEGDVVNENI
ncbi:MAG: sigma-70 family RNA polymerase sigma factor [Clostridia bacterium]|nr:sigma-70 family RNA polymerase sigma factor [Clostridia bacterium]